MNAFFPQGFITAIGNRDRRIRLALEHSLAPVIHGVMTSVLAVLMLSTSPFEFIVRHFLWLLLSVMVIGAINGLFFFPILLSLIGPGAEIIPLQHPNRISTPSPPPKRIKHNNNYSNNKPLIVNTKRSSCSSSRVCNKAHHYHKNVNIHNEPSLTTITEEPQSWKSSASSIASGHEMGGGYGNVNGNMSDRSTSGGLRSSPELQSIVVQPEVTVETHHTGDNLNGGTKVTATANIKVELVTQPGRPIQTATTTTRTSKYSS